MKLYTPSKIYIEKSARPFALTQTILNRLPEVPYEEIGDVRALMEDIRQQRDPIGVGKRVLFLAYDRGQSFKPFPEAEQYLSCDYFTLHVAEGCDLECSYCILQAYLTNPMLTVFVNIEEMLENLQQILNQNPDRFFRIGTGQLADSLSLDHITGFSEILVPFFARQKNALLELKTKSANIARLEALNPQGNTIVSWSMNSQRVQEQEEHKCASLNERLACAQKIASRPGWRVAFHFDPILDYPDWETEYAEIFRSVFTPIAHNKIAWASLGCLRMMPQLKPIMEERFPKSNAAYAEWITGMDGKLRYFKPRRIEIYKKAVGLIRALAPTVTLYLSMESPEVWERVFGKPVTRQEVCSLLDHAGR